MASPRPFRFGVQRTSFTSVTNREEWLQLARRLDSLAFDTLLVPDHFPRGLGALSLMGFLAGVTERLRIGPFVLCNDFRHPAVLAKEAASIDLLSGGRLELGIGAGWMKEEYDQVGIPFDRPSVRIERLAEATRLIKRIWREEPLTAQGTYYSFDALTLPPPPVQRPHPPILMGGGGKKMLTLAGQEADIVGFIPRAGEGNNSDVTEATVREKVGWVREGAGERFDQIELNIFVYSLEITDDPQSAAQALTSEYDVSPEEVLTSPHVLIGTETEIIETLQRRREELGISYIVVPIPLAEKMAPIAGKLRGK